MVGAWRSDVPVEFHAIGDHVLAACVVSEVAGFSRMECSFMQAVRTALVQHCESSVSCRIFSIVSVGIVMHAATWLFMCI